MEELIGFVEAYNIEDGETTRRNTITAEGHEGARFPALNPNAWVLANQGWHHVCNSRSLYVTFEEIDPMPTYSRFGKTGDIAVGIGMVRLPIRLKDGQTLRLPFGEVLFVPTRKTNSLSLKRLHHSGTVIDHRSGFAYDANDRNIMWFPNSGGLPTLRLDGLPDRLYLDSFTDDERSASYSDCWIRQQPLTKAVNGFAEALQAVHKIKDCNPRADPALMRRLLAKKVVNVTVEDLVKLLGIHCLNSSPSRGRSLIESSPPQNARPYSTGGARPHLGVRSSAPPGVRLSAQMKKPLATRNEFIKNQWGLRQVFQSSYGLKMSPEDIEEGDAILERFRRNGFFR